MKKKSLICLIMIAIFIIFLVPLSAFAYPGGEFNGKSLNYGNQNNIGTPNSPAATNLATDGDLSTSVPLSTGSVTGQKNAIWGNFSSPQTIVGIQVSSNSSVLRYGYRVFGESSIRYGNIDVLSGTLTLNLSNVIGFGFYAPGASVISLYEADVFVRQDPPNKPTGLTATLSSGQANLTWTANADPVSGYNVYKNGIKVNTSLVTGNSYQATDLENNTTYYWTITAVGSTGLESVASDQISTMFDSISPLAPIGLTAITGSVNGDVELFWTANNESDLAGYNAYQNEQKINGTVITQPSYSVHGLQNNTTYIFAVTALDRSNNESEMSNSVTYYFDSAAPAKPTGLKATPGNQKATLSWSSNTDSDLKGYFIYSGNTRLNTNPVTATTFEISGLTTGTIYTYTVSAVDLSGNESNRSDPISVTPIGPPPPAPGTGIVYDPTKLGFSAADIFTNSVVIFGFISLFVLLSIVINRTTPKVFELVRKAFK